MNGGSGIKAVIFDLGNVLIDFDYGRAAARIFKFTRKTPEELLRFFFESDIPPLFEAGGISPQDFFLKVKEEIGLDLGFEDFVPIWNEIFFLSEKNDRVNEIVRNLKKRYKLAFLSNINILHLNYIRRKFPSVLNEFDYRFSSCELRFIKPQEDIYRKALSELGVKPQEAFYTDDRDELVEGAARLGIKGFVFRSPDQLLQDLAGQGVKV